MNGKISESGWLPAPKRLESGEIQKEKTETKKESVYN